MMRRRHASRALLDPSHALASDRHRTPRPCVAPAASRAPYPGLEPGWRAVSAVVWRRREQALVAAMMAESAVPLAAWAAVALIALVAGAGARAALAQAGGRRRRWR